MASCTSRTIQMRFRQSVIKICDHLQLFMIALGKIFDFLFNLLDISNMNVAPFQLWNLSENVFHLGNRCGWFLEAAFSLDS